MGVEVPAAPAVPPLVVDELDPEGEPGLMDVPAALVAMAVLGMQGRLLVPELLEVVEVSPEGWLGAGGIWQLAGLAAAVVESLVAGALAPVPVAVVGGEGVIVLAARALPAFSGRFGRAACAPCRECPGDAELCCTGAGAAAERGAAAVAATEPSAEVPCPTLTERLA